MAGNPQVPDGWCIARLGDVATLRPSQQDSDTDNDLPYVGLEHIANGGTLIGKDAAGDYISLKTRFEAGDTLFGKLRPNLRKVVRAPFNGMSSTEILAIVARSPADKNFLSYVLRSDPMHNHTMQGITGTKMPRTSWSHMKNYGFLLPSLAEQRAIAGVLDAIDDAIERTEAVIAATERLRDALLHELLTRGVPGWHTEWKDAPGLGTIPADWEVVRLGEVAEVKSGTGFPLEKQGRQTGTFPFIKVSDMNLLGNETYIRSANNYVNKEDADELGANVFTPGTIVFPKVGAAIATNKKRVLKDRTIIDNNMAGVTVTAVGRCDRRFLYCWFESVDLFEFANVSAVPSITGSRLKRALILLPAKAEQQAIAAALGGVDEAVEQARQERDGLQLLKASAADALLSGRVRVNGGSIDV